MHLRELWEQKVGLAIAFGLAILVTTRLLYGISLFPPSLERHPLGLASASTHVVVDTPRSSIVDLRQETYSLTELTNRALLLGNVMASLPVREYIGRHADVPPDVIRVSSPLTLDQPRAIADSEHRPKSSDILKSPEEYRLSIQANPTVPILDIYSEAPDRATAVKLANAAVEGLRDYLHAFASSHDTPKSERARLVQLGTATGGLIDPGAGFQIAILAFVLVFSASCATVLFLARVRRGWAASEGLESRSARDPA